jgi:hypothetical protein
VDPTFHRGAVIDHRAVATRWVVTSQKKGPPEGVPDLQLAVLRCDCAVDHVCDFIKVFDLGVEQD